MLEVAIWVLNNQIIPKPEKCPKEIQYDYRLLQGSQGSHDKPHKNTNHRVITVTQTSEIEAANDSTDSQSPKSKLTAYTLNTLVSKLYYYYVACTLFNST